MRRGFTLIELLIVILLIGLLIAMAAPAILQSREASRRATCMSHQHEILRGIASFEQIKGRFPGWREQLGIPPQAKSVSWHFVLLPYLERRDLHASYGPGGHRADSDPTEQVDIFLCPSDLPGAGHAPASYSVNCGMQDAATTSGATGADAKANGVFHDMNRLWNHHRTLVEFRTADLVDGGPMTIALADRTETVSWIDWQQERRVGLWWQNTLNPPIAARINGVKPPLNESKLLDHVRPSSGHAGGVVVGFADGHGQFISEEVDYLVYALLMTPDGGRARLPDGAPVLKEFRKSTIPSGALAE